MLRYKNLAIIGTSHISRESVTEITAFIEHEKPEIIAVELDRRRLHGLLHNAKSKVSIRDISAVGLKGFIFALIASTLQKKLGKVVRLDPGADMKSAATLAIQKGLKLALIDQDIMITLKKFSKRLSWEERFRFIGDIFRSIFFRKREMKRLGIDKIDLTKVPEKELIKKMMDELKKRYPNVYSVLVAERNELMANRLVRLMKTEPDSLMLATVGAAHADELVRIIKKRFGE